MDLSEDQLSVFKKVRMSASAEAFPGFAESKRKVRVAHQRTSSRITTTILSFETCQLVADRWGRDVPFHPFFETIGAQSLPALFC